MATGRKAFEGKSQANVIGSILKEQPPAPSSLAPMTPPALDRVIGTCLAKEPAERIQTALDGSAEEEVLLVSDHDKYGATFTDGGRSLLFTQVSPETGFEMRILPLGGGRKPEPLRKSKLNEIASPLSPDGRWLPYSSEESGRWEVYVTSFPGAGRKWQVSSGGGAYAYWSADGREIIYHDLGGMLHDLGGMLHAVAVTARGETLEVGEPRPLFRVPGPNPSGSTFCPTADHQRFLVVGGGQKPNALLDLVVSWPLQLHRAK